MNNEKPIPLSDVALCSDAYAAIESLAKSLSASGHFALANEAESVLGQVRALGAQLCQHVEGR